MQFSHIFLALMAASATSAIPIEGTTAVEVPEGLEKRASIASVTCKGVDTNDHQTWSVADIKSSYNAGKKNVDSKDGKIKAGITTVKKYGNNAAAVLKDQPAECKTAQLYEYKLKGSNTDRVIWGWNKTSKSQFYCMVITHRGKSENDFKACV
ncbi:hypothetical protein B0J14DRAFT_638354 [Halenospora varia]|nr:hypothetical protein B0J14DRAFT_638354 [Halenospora varia]